MESCTITNIGVPFTITFPGGLMYRNGIVYTYNQSSPFQLWSIDTVTGTHTLVFNMTGVPQANLTGMCWDGTTVYGMSTSITQSQIFTINMTTGVCTPIGAASSVCAGGITLLGRLGAQYSLFAIDIVADNLYRFNKTTGAATLVGPLGFDTNFGQDGSYDPNDGTFYVVVFTHQPELRKIDTAGIVSPWICTYPVQVTGLACVPVSTPPGPPAFTLCRGGLNVNIPDHGWGRDSVNLILGSGGMILDMNVRIDTVIHTWDADLTFYLNRNTTGIKLINKVGGSGDNFIGTVLNDSATAELPSGVAPFTGSYKPFEALSIFNGWHSSGYFRLSISDTAGGDTGLLKRWCLIVSFTIFDGGIQTIEIPNYYFLGQNYPNPFNPATVIKFGVPQSGDVKLVIYDILGREVSTLVNEHKHPGTYEENFDASHLSSGVYFYSIQTDNFRETKRMLLIK
jgi:hypothetical protein